jgi:DNA-directed RNA polymerase II subunit RPB1
MFKCAPASSAVNSDTSITGGASAYPRIQRIRLGILTAEEIERNKGAVLTEHMVYARNLPKTLGPNDPGMGCSDRRVLCNTCRCAWFKCPGHPGVLRLPICLYHVQYMPTTFKLLQCVCWVCGALKGRVPDPVPNAAPGAQFLLAYDAGKGRFKCPECQCPQPRYKKAGPMMIRREWKEAHLTTLGTISPALARTAQRPFTATDALLIFQSMSDATVRKVGMDPLVSHPSSMILQNLCVLPPNARPAIMAAEGSKRKGQDDITSQLQDIVKSCRALRRAMAGAACEPEATPEFEYLHHDPLSMTAENLFLPWSCTVVDTLRQILPDVVATTTPDQAAAAWTAFPTQCERLQDQVTVMINNGGRFAPLVRQRTGVPKRSLVARLVGKAGRIRGNIFARRTDQNARSVIKPDRWLDIDQLGVPQVFMNTLTKPEEVHAGNRARLQAAVNAGPGVRGGAARVLRADGRLLQLHLLKPHMPRVVIEPGDVVERHLRDGDVGIFNRQPTLHRLGMMAHRLVGVPGEAFCVPLAVMGPYNADCDGDEMNLHILQSIHGDAEARLLLAVQANVINPQTNSPCVSLVQDARVGAMLLTKSSTFLSEKEAHACATAIHYKQPGKETLPVPCRKDPATGLPQWSGRQLVTMLIPQGVSLTKRVRGAGPEDGPDDPEDRYIEIVDGTLNHGALCKATLGTGIGSLVHRIHLVSGPRAVVQFLSDFQRMVYTWMPMRGFTMGLQDCLASQDTKALVRHAVLNADHTVESLTRRAAELGPGALAPTEAATLEAHLLTILTSVLDFGSRCVLEDGDSGSGGGGFRSMVSAGSKGNTNNVAQVMACLGQQVIEGGRVAPSGANLRTLPCFPPGAYSATARGFITHSYADGVNPAEYYYHMMAGREGLTATAVKTSETGYKYRVMAKAMETNTVRWDGTVRNGQSYILECVAGGDCCAATAAQRVDMTSCIHASRDELVARMGGPGPRAQFALKAQGRLRAGLFTPCLQGSTNLLLAVQPLDELAAVSTSVTAARIRFPAHAQDPDEALRCAVDGLVENILGFLPSPECGHALALALLWEMTPTALRAAGIHTSRAFHDTVGAATFERFLDSVVAPGESVGIVAAQSIGEPSTQLTLNVFHHAGMLDRHLTSGVPRLKEILSAAPKIRTPSTTAPIRTGANLSPPAAAKAALSLQFLCLDTAVHSSYVVQDPLQKSAPWTTIAKDSMLVQHVVHVFGPEPAVASPWVIRLTLNRAILAEASMTPEAVSRAVAAQLPPAASVSIVHSEPNMRRWVLRLRLLNDDTEHGARALHSYLREAVLLGGIHGVKSARVTEVKRTLVDADTGAVRTDTRMAVDVEGTALRALATRDWVHWEHVITNDIVEVAQVLGMVAARAVLFAELDRVISTGGGHVDPRHLAQVVATMTHRGWLMPLTRHGINRVNLSVLQRTSFEQPVDMLLQGAMQGQSDPLRGLCECVYVGAKPPVGTGTVAVQEDYATDMAPSAARAMVVSREMQNHPGQGKHFRDRRDATKHGRVPRRGGARPAGAPAATARVPNALACDDVAEFLEALLGAETNAAPAALTMPEHPAAPPCSSSNTLGASCIATATTAAAAAAAPYMPKPTPELLAQVAASDAFASTSDAPASA